MKTHLARADQRRSRSVCGSFTFTIRSARPKISSGPADQLGARPQIIVIGQAGAHAGPGLDEHLVPAADQLLDADRQHRHAVFVLLDLFRHADDHGRWLREGSSSWRDCVQVA